jgi:hypothetical protein
MFKNKGEIGLGLHNRVCFVLVGTIEHLEHIIYILYNNGSKKIPCPPPLLGGGCGIGCSMFHVPD